jgi:phosphomethylpyrimidine synthase
MVEKSLIQRVAKDEGSDPEKLGRLVRSGRVAIVKNAHRDIAPLGIGEGLRTKINVNLGTSPAKTDVELELRKLKTAIGYGADTVMDLSTGGDIDKVRRSLIKECKIPFGTVPVYQAFKLNEHPETDINIMLKVIEKHCRDGVDFVTLHCGLTKASLPLIKKRLMGVVSRGGALLAKWMADNDAENPLYENFDSVLEILREHEVVISLGDGLRPGCLRDATDEAQMHELRILGELTKRARASGVQAIIEGPGHIPLDQIEFNVRKQKEICDGAPFYVLGPIVTDVAPGYDHITSAIGGALAAYYGVDFLCAVSPKEHLGLPNVEDIKQATISSRIAAHAGDIAKHVPGAREWDDEMSRARANLDWGRMFELALDPKTAKKMRAECPVKGDEVCSMCGEFCSVKISKDLLKDEIKEG